MSGEPGWVHYLHALVYFVGELVEGNPVAWVGLLIFITVMVFAIRHDLRANRKSRRSAEAKPESKENGQP
jgi:hypothetical protein